MVATVARGQAGLDRLIGRGEEIAELGGEAGEGGADLCGREFVEMGGREPQAPWTATWMKKAPRASRSGVVEKAQSGITGRARRAAMMIVRRRPIFCESEPNQTPPMMAPTLATIASALT